VTVLLRAALTGAATGCRTFTGLAPLVLATPPRPVTQPDRMLSTGWVKGPGGVAGRQELTLGFARAAIAEV